MATRRAHGLALVCMLLAACGTSHPVAKGPPAQRVCTAASSAAARVLGGRVGFSVTNSDPTYIECLIDAHGDGLMILAEASPQAYTAYNTATAHLAQAYGAAGQSQNPLSVPGVGTVASWFPGERQLVATNGSPSRGGSFVTVSITRWRRTAPSQLTVARAVARRVFAVAPRA